MAEILRNKQIRNQRIHADRDSVAGLNDVFPAGDRYAIEAFAASVGKFDGCFMDGSLKDFTVDMRSDFHALFSFLRVGGRCRSTSAGLSMRGLP